MMAAATSTVKGEFQTVLFSSTGPVVGFRVNIKVVNDIAGAGFALYHEKLEEITMGQVTIDTLSRKPLRILAAVDRLLPGRPEGCHDMATDTKGIGIGGLNHKT